MAEDTHHEVQNSGADIPLSLGDRGRSPAGKGAQLKDLVVDLDDIVADDHLTLIAAAHDPHDPGDLFQSSLIHFAGVHDGKPQAGGAVFKVGYIFVPAHQPEDFLRNICVVFCHVNISSPECKFTFYK